MERTFINALAKAKRESKKVEYDESQTMDIAEIVSRGYLLREDEKEILIKRLEKYVAKMNDIYNLPFEEFCKLVEGK